MAHPDAYQEFGKLQTRYWSLLLRGFAIGIAAILLVSLKSSLPDWFFGIAFFFAVIAFAITWFQCAATYFRAMNWRCPDCQQRFTGLRVGIALMNSILNQRCRHCGKKPDYDSQLPAGINSA